MFKAKFKTAYLQREIPEDAIVLGDLVVGELVKITPATDVLPAIVEKLEAETVAAAKEEASHFMAQSDMTMGYGHVPVEYRDYRYSDEIKATVDLTSLGNSFRGVFENTSAITSPTSGDTALILEDGVLNKYAYTNAWAKDTSYSVALVEASKKVATFKITNIDDIVAYDGE